MPRFLDFIRPSPRPPSLLPPARNLCIGGHALILLAVEDMLLRLSDPPSADALLYLEHFAGSLASSLVLLWLGVLGLDLLSRRALR